MTNAAKLIWLRNELSMLNSDQVVRDMIKIEAVRIEINRVRLLPEMDEYKELELCCA